MLLRIEHLQDDLKITSSIRAKMRARRANPSLILQKCMAVARGTPKKPQKFMAVGMAVIIDSLHKRGMAVGEQSPKFHGCCNWFIT